MVPFDSFLLNFAEKNKELYYVCNGVLPLSHKYNARYSYISEPIFIHTTISAIRRLSTYWYCYYITANPVMYNRYFQPLWKLWNTSSLLILWREIVDCPHLTCRVHWESTSSFLVVFWQIYVWLAMFIERAHIHSLWCYDRFVARKRC